MLFDVVFEIECKGTKNNRNTQIYTHIFVNIFLLFEKYKHFTFVNTSFKAPSVEQFQKISFRKYRPFPAVGKHIYSTACYITTIKTRNVHILSTIYKILNTK